MQFFSVLDHRESAWSQNYKNKRITKGQANLKLKLGLKIKLTFTFLQENDV